MKCLCGYCNKFYKNHSSGEPKICPVAFICDNKPCVCEFCQLPSIAKEAPYANAILFPIFHHSELAKKEFEKEKMVNEVYQIMSKQWNDFERARQEYLQKNKMNEKSMKK